MNTLDSYLKYYDPDTIELCVVEDMPRTGEPTAERILKKYPFRYQYRLVDRRSGAWNNPAPLYNVAASMASHSIIGLTNPENLHMGPVFTHAVSSLRDNEYLVYACASIDFTPKSLSECESLWDKPGYRTELGGHSWYIHSKHYPRLLHFMSVMNASDYCSIGGFDEEYENGYCYEDDDFVRRVKKHGMKISIVDDPFVIHQFHSRGHHSTVMNGVCGLQKNKDLFISKWGNVLA